jgi:hypothetical protein
MSSQEMEIEGNMKPVDLKRALNELGNSSQEVYEKLKTKGIRGKLGSSKSCPIANYLEFLTGHPMSVGMRTYNYCGTEKHLHDDDLPVAIRVFIQRFDDKVFPDMVE